MTRSIVAPLLGELQRIAARAGTQRAAGRLRPVAARATTAAAHPPRPTGRGASVSGHKWEGNGVEDGGDTT